MAVASTRAITITFAGDLELADSFDAEANAGSPGVVEYKSLAVGFNTITIPAGTVTGLTIVPPVDNTNGLTLKGVTGDTGVPLRPNSPTSLALTGTPTLGITVATGVTLVRFIWT